MIASFILPSPTNPNVGLVTTPPLANAWNPPVAIPPVAKPKKFAIFPPALLIPSPTEETMLFNFPPALEAQPEIAEPAEEAQPEIFSPAEEAQPEIAEPAEEAQPEIFSPDLEAQPEIFSLVLDAKSTIPFLKDEFGSENTLNDSDTGYLLQHLQHHL
jgi:hypothetical protein